MGSMDGKQDQSCMTSGLTISAAICALIACLAWSGGLVWMMVLGIQALVKYLSE